MIKETFPSVPSVGPCTSTFEREAAEAKWDKELWDAKIPQHQVIDQIVFSRSNGNPSIPKTPEASTSSTENEAAETAWDREMGTIMDDVPELIKEIVVYPVPTVLINS